MAKLVRVHFRSFFGIDLSVVIEPINVIGKKVLGKERWYLLGYDGYGRQQVFDFDRITHTTVPDDKDETAHHVARINPVPALRSVQETYE